MYYFGFSKQERTGLLIILTVLFVVTGLNLRISIRRARDAQRKNDLGSIHDTLLKHQAQYGLFPFATDDGRIIGCHPTQDEKGVIKFEPCNWHADSFGQMQVLNGDPHSRQSVAYFYISNGKRFQIFAALEGADEPEYDPVILKRNIKCGVKTCNFGRAPGRTPLDKTLEEYENELNEEK